MNTVQFNKAQDHIIIYSQDGQITKVKHHLKQTIIFNLLLMGAVVQFDPPVVEYVPVLHWHTPPVHVALYPQIEELAHAERQFCPLFVCETRPA